MRRLVIAALVALLATSGPALATAQRGDVLVLDGDEHTLHTNPLEPYLRAHPERRPRSGVISTSLWRGYVATWEIDEERLFLTDLEVLQASEIEGESTTELRSVLEEIFPGEPRVLADWFTGHLIVPLGKLTSYVHMDYSSTFERYTLLTIVAGRVDARREMRAREYLGFRRRQFRAYQKTAEYLAELEDSRDDFDTLEEAESFLYRYLTARFTSTLFPEPP